MRLEFDEQGYVCCILYGCYTGSCVEYAGLVPTQPEEYTDIDDWAERAQTQAYKLDDEGNLIYDADRAASLPNEDDVVLPTYTEKELKALGITDAIQSAIKAALEEATPPFDTIYPIGSIYMSMNATSPEELFGGSWERIEDRFLLAAGNVDGGSSGGSTSHSHTAPVGYNTDNNLFGVSFAQGSGTAPINAEFATTNQTAITGSGTFNWRLARTDSVDHLPPYLAVYVWKRIA